MCSQAKPGPYLTDSIPIDFTEYLIHAKHSESGIFKIVFASSQAPVQPIAGLQLGNFWVRWDKRVQTPSGSEFSSLLLIPHMLYSEIRE